MNLYASVAYHADEVKDHIIEPRSNGPTFNGFPPLTDIYFLSHEPVFFYCLNWPFYRTNLNNREINPFLV